MSDPEPFFPAPQKKDAAPYRSSSASAAEPAPKRTVVRRPDAAPKEPDYAKAAARAAAAQPYLPVPEDEPLVRSFFVRLGIRIGALAMVAGALKLVAWLSDGGAKWPQAIVIVLGIAGFLAAPFVLWMRLRRILRILFTPKNDR